MFRAAPSVLIGRDKAKGADSERRTEKEEALAGGRGIAPHRNFGRHLQGGGEQTRRAMRGVAVRFGGAAGPLTCWFCCCFCCFRRPHVVEVAHATQDSQLLVHCGVDGHTYCSAAVSPCRRRRLSTCRRRRRPRRGHMRLQRAPRLFDCLNCDLKKLCDFGYATAAAVLRGEPLMSKSSTAPAPPIQVVAPRTARPSGATAACPTPRSAAAAPTSNHVLNKRGATYMQSSARACAWART